MEVFRVPHPPSDRRCSAEETPREQEDDAVLECLKLRPTAWLLRQATSVQWKTLCWSLPPLPRPVISSTTSAVSPATEEAHNPKKSRTPSTR